MTIMNNKLENMFVLCLFMIIHIQTGNSMPQGFFGQRLSLPNIVSWNKNDRTLSILPNVKVSSPIKNSHFTLFGKKNTGTVQKNKIDQQQNNKLDQPNEEFKPDQALPEKINQENNPEQINAFHGIKFPNEEQEDQLVSKYSDYNVKEPDIRNEVTTEPLIETTTEDVETTTLEDVFNRASPQLVASLLG